MNLALFESLIKEKTGLSFGVGRSARLVEVIRSVMAAKGIHSSAAFYELIVSSPSEFVDLINLLTVNETYFFREPIQLKLLSERLAPELLKRRRVGARIRILSAGCSTGEEPYSLVMALMERMGSRINTQFEVMGVDIDSDAIEKARKGVYGRQSFRGFDERLREKYFDKAGSNSCRLKDFVKEMVQLRVLNLSSDLSSEDLRNLDVIFYRNVSIYFEPDTQRRIFRNLSRTLSVGGYFITSATETLSHDLNVLSLIESEGVFFYQKQAEPADRRTGTAAGRSGGQIGSEQKSCSPAYLFDGVGSLPKWTFGTPRGRTLSSSHGFPEEKTETPVATGTEIDALPRSGWPEALRVHTPPVEQSGIPPAAVMEMPGRGERYEPTEGKNPEESFAEAVSLAEEKKYDRALALIDELSAREPSFIRVYALKGNLLFNLGRLDEAEQACLKAVEFDELCLEGYLLLALAARNKGDHDTSVRRFREALYVRPSCWLAHFYLAEIHHSRGELEKARREYSIIMSLSERGELTDTGLSFFPLAISVEQMIHLCRHKLTNLGEAR